MSDLIEGVIHGRTIELTTDPGIADGQKVEITIRAVPQEGRWGDGIRATAGALAHLPAEDWEALDEIVRQREGAGRRREIAE